MRIKIIDNKPEAATLTNLQLQIGHAYRLVKSGVQSTANNEGNVYTPMRSGNMFNFNTSTTRDPSDRDKWIEVDMEIIIKEKS